MMSYGVQFVSLSVILIILFSYFQSERMDFMSTRCFSAFLVLALFNILAEFSSLYTIYHIDTVPPWINRLCHQLFIGSLDAMILFFFFYVDIKTRRQQRYDLRQLLPRLLPAAFALFMVIFGELNYYVGPDGRYSYGTMAMSVYCSVAVYLFLALRRLLSPDSCFSKSEKYNLLPGIFIWIIIAVVQFSHPTLLVSSLAVAVMVQFVYISFENPREFLELTLENVMSRYAFELMLTELTQRKKPFHLFCMADKGSLSPYDTSTVLQKMADTLNICTDCMVYNYGNNLVVSIVSDPQKYLSVLNQAKRSASRYSSNSFPIPVDCFWSVIECPQCAEDTDSIKSLLDFVCREGKKRDSSDIWIIDNEVIQRKEYLSQVEYLLRQALREDGLEIYYQPIFCTKTNRFRSCEALVRLKDCGTLGFVSPEIFIPIAEQCGLIGELGLSVFQKVCAFSAENHLPDMGLDYVEINLSALQSIDTHLPETLDRCIHQYGLTPNFINLEITETAAVEAGDAFFNNMETLKNAGFHFSMDDFGTGYSNLAKLADTNFDLIKLDKSLLWPCFESENDNALVVLDTCIDMIHKLGAAIVAEGVETAQQVDLLRNKNVEYLQGYYFSRPLSAESYLEFLKTNS